MKIPKGHFMYSLQLNGQAIEFSNSEGINDTSKQIIMSRGMAPGGSDFVKWIQTSLNGNSSRTPLLILLVQNENGDTEILYQFYNCLPLIWQATEELNGTQFIVERFIFTFDSMSTQKV